MNTGGWIILIVSVGTVCILFAWCLYKVLTTPEETEHLHGFDGDLPEDEQEKKDSI